MPASETRTDSRGVRTHPLSSVVQGGIYAGVAAVAVFSGLTRNTEDVVVRLVATLGALLLGFVAGSVQWWFTRYVIDGTEIRVHTGAVFKSSRRIPFERLQSVDISEPIFARVFGLAELRLEMAGGGKSRTTLRYLPLGDARSLRRLILERAHGRAADDRMDGAVEDDFGDFAPANQSVICRVGPARVLQAAVLSLDFAALTLVLAVVVGVGMIADTVIGALAATFPLALAWLQFLSRRVIGQWEFMLTDTPSGLRIQRGLLTRSSQTLPFDRIQGVASVEPLIWRQLGWRRLDVDVAGYASSDDETSSKPSTTLLPVADRPLAFRVIERILPGACENQMEHTGVSAKSRWFAPIGWRFRWLGVGRTTICSATGWITRRVSLVPHHKTQSVALRQGPLQRLLGLATLDVHTPDGPVRARVKHLDAPAARRQAVEQLTRARQARS